MSDNGEDLSIFENNEKAMDCKGSIKNCLALNRISRGLQYFSLFDIIHNETDQEIIGHFLKEIYKEILNDYTHLMKEHNHQLQEIKESLINDKKLKECDLSKCVFTARHHRTDHDDDNTQNKLDPFLNFAKETMDGLHFYLFHLFDCGLRTLNSDDNDDNKDTVNNKCIDTQFARLTQRIDETRSKTEAFGRFKVNDKFNIEVETNKEGIIITETDEKPTFLDEMVRYLLQIGIDDKYIIHLICLLGDAKYDSDSLKFDVKINGNIFNKMDNKRCILSIKKCVSMAQIHSSSFSIGLRFYYWSFYKDIKQLPQKEQNDDYTAMHCGYNICELYIKQKYGSFKEEMSHYPRFNMKQYNDIVVIKAQSFKDTDIVRRTKRFDDEGWITKLHYDIGKETTLQFNHLCSLVMYTDFSDLCTDFTRSFRKRSVFESLGSLKRRNSEYWWFSKTLRESVECFGQCRDEDDTNSGLKGPFYTGMSRIMVIPEFHIRLCSPISTSKQIEIAMRFSGSSGIIIQLNNTSEGEYDILRAFDCSWLSRYPEEDERLFFGGFSRIKVVSVRIIETKQNFEEFMSALYYLDAMITGAWGIKKLKQSNRNKVIIETLFKWILHQKKDENIDEYIYETFIAYFKHKKHIILDLWLLFDDADKDMIDLMMYSLEKGDKARDDDDKRNLLREETVKIFKDAETVLIVTTEWDGSSQYPLSMSALLSLLEQSSWKEVTVKAVKDEDNKDSWISTLWENHESTLTTEYQQKKYNILFKNVMNGDNEEEHLLMINKISS